jgi:hypothetical protein
LRISREEAAIFFSSGNGQFCWWECVADSISTRIFPPPTPILVHRTDIVSCLQALRSSRFAYGSVPVVFRADIDAYRACKDHAPHTAKPGGLKAVVHAKYVELHGKVRSPDIDMVYARLMTTSGLKVQE